MSIKHTESINKSTQIKKAFYSVILSSSCHGLPNIFKATKKIIKFVWLICLILSAVLCFIFIWEQITNYLRYDVTTKIRVKSEFIANFPAVTICNINPFTSEKAANLFELCKNQNLTYSFIKKDYTFKEKFKSCLIKLKLANLKIYGDFKNKIINQSRFNWQPTDDFVYFNHSEYGNCYTFNSGQSQNGSMVTIKSQKRTRKFEGLILHLDLSVHQKLRDYVFEYGSMIFIHNQTIQPYFVNGILIGKGLETSIGLRRTFIRTEPKPYSLCDGNTNKPDSHKSKLYRLILKKFGYYTQDFCVEQCFQKKVYQMCNCTVSFIDSVFDAKDMCENYEKMVIRNCWFDIDDKFYTIKNIEKECIPLCPLECEKQSFDYIFSVKKLDTQNENQAVVNIFYENLAFTEIEESPTICFANLISGIGGTLGLFLGISFLSLVEVFDILFQLFFIIFQKKKIELTN